MAVNRYTRLFDPGTVRGPEYIPMPFQEIAAVGDAKQHRYDQAVQEEDAISALQSKIKPLDEVKGYGPNGLDYYKTGQSQEVQSYFDNVRKELATKAEEIAKGDKGSSAYLNYLKRKGSEISSLVSPTGKFGQYTQDNENYQKMVDEISKNKDLDKANWLANKAYTNVGGFLQGKNRITPQALGQYVDRNKELDDLTHGINEELTSLYASPDGQGYIRHGKKEEITKDKISKTVDNFFTNSATANDIHDELIHKINSGYMNPEDYNKEFSKRKTDLKNALIAKYTKSTGDAGISSDATALQREKELKKAQEYIASGAAEGVTSSETTDNHLNNLGLNGVFNPDGSVNKDFQNSITKSIQPVSAKGVTNEKGITVTPSAGTGYSATSAEYLSQKDKEKANKLTTMMSNLGIEKPEEFYAYQQNVAKQTNQYPLVHQQIGVNIGKDMFGSNTDINTTKMYLQGQPGTSEQIDNLKATISKNTNVRGIDFNAEQPGALVVTTTPKDGKNTAGIDTPIIVQSKNLNLQSEMKPMWQASKNANTFATTGEVDKNAFDRNVPNNSDIVKLIQQRALTENTPYQKVVGTVTQPLKNGATRFRFSLYGIQNNEPQLGYTEIDYDKDGNPLNKSINFRSLLNAQELERDRIQSEGALKKYGTTIKENIKTSDLEEDQ